MEAESLSQKTFGSARERILENIKALGFQAQNERLYSLGFTKFSQNLKYLKLYNGDVDQILAHFENKDKGNPEKEPHEHKKERKERGPKEDLPALEFEELEDWPSHIQTLYLDGNNMLYVEDKIRNMAIGRKNKLAEQILADLAINFTGAFGTFNTVLVFDSTKQIGSQDVVAKNGKTVKFTVISAAPNFKSADDSLVKITDNLGNTINQCLFVTSDRELQVRLSKNGVENISKTKRWFDLVRRTLGDEEYQAILSEV